MEKYAEKQRSVGLLQQAQHDAARQNVGLRGRGRRNGISQRLTQPGPNDVSLTLELPLALMRITVIICSSNSGVCIDTAKMPRSEGEALGDGCGALQENGRVAAAQRNARARNSGFDFLTAGSLCYV